MLALIQNGPTQMVSGNIFEGLLRYSPKLEPLPGLAVTTAVQVSATAMGASELDSYRAALLVPVGIGLLGVAVTLPPAVRAPRACVAGA